MSTYFYIISAVFLSSFSTLLLPASQSCTKLVPTTLMIACNAIALFSLSFIANKMSLAIIYAIWSALNIFLISLASYFIYKQTLNIYAIIGLTLITIGVVLVNAFQSTG
ncbi:MAG: DMT family transporter [Candidatus Comchoanobacterales bacterium]